MRAGVIERDACHTVVLELGDRWIDATRAWRDYNEFVEERTAARLNDVGCLIAAGLMTRSGYRRLTEFVQRHGRVNDYVVPGEPPFCQPLTPGKIIAIGRNYAKHAAELGNECPEEPMFFNKIPSICIGPEQAIEHPEWVGRVDYEGELALVIGRSGRNITEEEADSYIAGYTLLNDVTARALQNLDKERGYPWTRAKNMETFCPVGPVVAYRESLPWPLEVDITTRVNGEVRQHSNTRYFLFSAARLIAYVSRYVALHPGDLIATGTPEGVGELHPGDVVEVEIPQIGVLRNPVVAA
jgi:2-keto-4-pentenoate hydratase/2-oxohepta-3-ene-1,7-dioic acid hydratase in catechol pathway